MRISAERRTFMDRIIFHIDVNSAYLSWSAIDLLQANPDSVDIRTIPAIIGGNRKTRHGIVLAKSLSAKNTYHIHTAEPVANALKKCPTLTIIPPDHDSYSRHSKQFVGFLRSLTSEIEQVSVMNVIWTIPQLPPASPHPKKARPISATIFTAILVLRSMWGSLPIRCWQRWLLTLKSRTRRTHFSLMRFRRKCGHFRSAVCSWQDMLP